MVKTKEEMIMSELTKMAINNRLNVLEERMGCVEKLEGKIDENVKAIRGLSLDSIDLVINSNIHDSEIETIKKDLACDKKPKCSKAAEVANSHRDKMSKEATGMTYCELLAFKVASDDYVETFFHTEVAARRGGFEAGVQWALELCK